MKHTDVKRYWDSNADAWTRLSRAGADVYRDHLNTPAFFRILPDVRGLDGVDIGCGEGSNTRLLARRGARVAGFDISDVFIRHAAGAERAERSGINYLAASAVEIPFADAVFDFATGFMSFMDIAETEEVLSEAWRVLKPGGFLQFSITHPCFDTPHRRNLRNETGLTYALEVGDYFRNLDGDISEWLFSAATPDLKAGVPNFRIPRFTRTLAQWLNLLIAKGFLLEQVDEPTPSDAVIREHPNLQDARVAAFFLILRVRKPAGNTSSLPRTG
jgi:ubiquinone/menaquinone biosynthesis C-methylase UbiE